MDTSPRCVPPIGIGPGMGRSSAASQLLRDILAQADCPVVVDADGLNIASYTASDGYGIISLIFIILCQPCCRLLEEVSGLLDLGGPIR